mmetsp:Transcript_112874/g.364539  ORF Transcript_112874/g.364539 Transcript_112874/m.364539 type:complete len:91 (+) Transcript_112874:206-478(+)
MMRRFKCMLGLLQMSPSTFQSRWPITRKPWTWSCQYVCCRGGSPQSIGRSRAGPALEDHNMKHRLGLNLSYRVCFPMLCRLRSIGLVALG